MSEQRIREDEDLEERTRGSTEDDFEREREKAVELFQERVKSGGKALNIAFIGASGCGKSSFCNSVMTAFCVEGWRERATVGHYGGLAEQITHHLMSFPKIEYLDFDALYDYNYPTLVDMNGFNDSCDDMVEELLRIVFFGRLPQEEKLMDAVKLYRSKGLDGLKEHYSRNYELLKIDRIIFIASATSPLPNRLMEAVRKTARKEDRVIPIFGVLTHKDKISEVDQDFQTLEKDFREGLGLPDNRFLLCTTYCDDYDRLHGKSRLDQRHPELDIPILKFMRQVCDPVFKVIKDQTKYNKNAGKPAADSTTPTETTDQKPEWQAPAWFGTAQGRPPAVDRRWIRWAVIAVLVYFLLPFLTNGLDISRVCAEQCTSSDHGTRCTSGSLQSLCAEQSSLRKVFVTFLFVGAIVGVDLLMDKLDQIGHTERN